MALSGMVFHPRRCIRNNFMQILEDIILVKILQILETAAAGGNCCCCLVVIWKSFIVSVLSPGRVGGCVRAAAAGSSETGQHAIKLTPLLSPYRSGVASLSSSELWTGAGPWGALRARLLHGAALSTDLHTYTYLLTHSPCVRCSVLDRGCGVHPLASSEIACVPASCCAGWAVHPGR